MGRLYWYRLCCWRNGPLGNLCDSSKLTRHCYFTAGPLHFRPGSNASFSHIPSELDENQKLEVKKTFRTNWRKQWSGNAFMACGVLYVLKKYDEKYTSLNYMYNTHTGQSKFVSKKLWVTAGVYNLLSEAFKFVDIPFTNKYEWNTMVDYSPVDQMIYAWDRGHQELLIKTLIPPL